MEANPVYIGHIATNNVKLKKNFEYGQRLNTIADHILSLKEKYPPSIICIERGFTRFNTSTQVIYRVHGLTNYLFNDVEQIYYPPKKVKAAILKGDATKKQVQDKIKKEFPNVEFNQIKIKKNKKEECKDESDAFAVGLTYFIEKGIVNL